MRVGPVVASPGRSPSDLSVSRASPCDFLLFVVLAGLLLPGCGLLGPADDTRAPLIELTRPGDGAVVGGDVLFRFTGEARGEDNFISFITVSVDGERVGEADLVTPGVNPVSRIASTRRSSRTAGTASRQRHSTKTRTAA